MITVDLLLQQSPALPTIPKVVQELIHTLDKEFVQTNEIARQLAADQVLSAKLLRLANSAFYNVPRTIYTIEDALKMLGFSTVRTLVVSTGMAANFKPIVGFDLKRFWRYSLHSAVGARYLAFKTSCDNELAFTVGLMHGIGRLVMLAGMAEEMKQISPAISPYPGQDRIEAERSAFGFTYADVGAELVQRWNFPEAFAEAIKGTATPLDSTPPKKLPAVIHLAAWRSRGEELGVNMDTFSNTWPTAIGNIASLSLQSVLHDMPPFSELSAGLEEMIGA